MVCERTAERSPFMLRWADAIGDVGHKGMVGIGHTRLRHIHSMSTVPQASLSISHTQLDCQAVARDLARLGIVARIDSNQSVVCEHNAAGTTGTTCRIERGCHILLPETTMDRVADTWRHLQARYTLSCAHLSVPPVFAGCVWDYLRPSQCPGRSKN